MFPSELGPVEKQTPGSVDGGSSLSLLINEVGLWGMAGPVPGIWFPNISIPSLYFKTHLMNCVVERGQDLAVTFPLC